jgi:hypothetical protein
LAVFLEDLKEDSPPWLNDAKFKDKYRMTYCSFWLIVDLIQNHGIFKSLRKLQAPVVNQLMMLLCFLGMEGNGLSNRKGWSVFLAGKGTMRIYKEVIYTILDCLYDSLIKWPDQDEQQIIREQIRAEFGLPN